MSRAGLALACLVAASVFGSDLKRDEEVLLFPTCAVVDESGRHWEVPVHGWVYEPEPDSVWRSLLVEEIGQRLALDRAALDRDLFRRRIGPFLADSERGKELVIELAGRRHRLGPSAADGHLRGEIVVEHEVLAEAAEDGWVELAVVVPPHDRRRFTGAARLLADEGLSVVSDIDDTIKDSDVRDASALLANTFLREFEAVPGMAGAYARWAREGAAFHYLSASPWQLYPALSEFIRGEGFPRGSFHLREVRIKDSSVLQLLTGPEVFKRGAISSLLTTYPRRRFVLVGDSAEHDPAVYAELTARFPTQVALVCIRDLSRDQEEARALREAFAGLPESRWMLFGDGDDLLDVNLARIIHQPPAARRWLPRSAALACARSLNSPPSAQCGRGLAHKASPSATR